MRSLAICMALHVDSGSRPRIGFSTGYISGRGLAATCNAGIVRVSCRLTTGGGGTASHIGYHICVFE